MLSQTRAIPFGHESCSAPFSLPVNFFLAPENSNWPSPCHTHTTYRMATNHAPPAIAPAIIDINSLSVELVSLICEHVSVSPRQTALPTRGHPTLTHTSCSTMVTLRYTLFGGPPCASMPSLRLSHTERLT
jgi:hypothetical protein